MCCARDFGGVYLDCCCKEFIGWHNGNNMILGEADNEGDNLYSFIMDKRLVSPCAKDNGWQGAETFFKAI